MKIKKLLSLVMALTIILTGCGSDAEAGAVDLADQKEIETFKFLGPWIDSDPNEMDEAQVLEDWTGIPGEFNTLPVSNGDEKLQLELSSGADYDAVQVSVEQFGKLSAQGALLDLAPYIDEFGPNLKANISQEAWNAVTNEEGQIFGIPRLGASEVLENQVYVRKDILEKEGLSVPETTDELLTTTCQLADAGYSTPWASGNQTYGDMPLRGAFGVAQAWNYDENDNLVYIGVDERYKQFLDFEKEMNECGAFGNDYETITFDDAVQRFVNGDAAFFPGAYWNANALATGLESKDGNFYEDVEIVPSFTGPDGYKLTTQASSSINYIIVVPEYKEEYAVSIIKYLDKVNEKEFLSSVLLGEEGTNYEVLDDGQIYVYNQPKFNEDKNWSNFFTFGGPSEVIETSTNSGVIERAKKLEDGTYIENGAEFANDYTLAVNDTQREFGEQNPISMVINAPLWSENSIAMNSEVADFSILYVSGNKTDEDWTALKDKLQNDYSADEAGKQLKEQVDRVEG